MKYRLIEITEINRLKLKSKSKSKIFVVEINLDDAQLKIEPTDDYLLELADNLALSPYFFYSGIAYPFVAQP